MKDKWENVKSEDAWSCPTLCDPWAVARSPPGSSVMGFSRQEYWSGLPFPSPGDLPDPGIKPGSPALQADSLPSEPPGKSRSIRTHMQKLLKYKWHYLPEGLPGSLVVKYPPAKAGVSGWTPGSLGEGNGNPLQYTCLENSMDWGAWWATYGRPWGHKESDPTEHALWLSD